MSAWDAVVIGGGPAGSGVATYLAREGRRVMLLERARFPREHIGESLLPGVLPYLEALGARELVEGAGFRRKLGQTFIWGRDRTPWRLDFRELDVYPYAYFVERSRFDAILLDHARRSGAEVVEERAVTRVLFEEGRAVGVVHRGPDGDEREERARFVVDASGASGVVARTAGLRRHVRGLKNLAVWSYWRGAERLSPPAESDILTVSVPDGWIWVIPIDAGRTSVGVVTSRATRGAREVDGLSSWYEATLRGCEPVWRLLASAKREGEVRAARDWSYRSRRLSGPGILLAGDAACFIDPILSTGVHLAMSSAYWAAATIHSCLDDPKMEGFFRRFYDETYAAMYRELLAQVKSFYRAEGRKDSIYWSSKKILRVGQTVPGNLAFLFITAGLLRNAATALPHDPLAQARAALGADALGPVPNSATRTGTARVVSPRLVWRAKPRAGASLVTVHQRGMRLSVVAFTPAGLRDRPRGGFLAFEMVDRDGSPLAMAIVDLHEGSEPSVVVQAYPARPRDEAMLNALREAVSRAVHGGAATSGALSRPRLRRAVSQATGLPPGVSVRPSRELRRGPLLEASLTAVFDATDAQSPLARLYLVVEARVPLELTDLPLVRTRFLDVWVRPGRTRDGREIGVLPDVAAFLSIGSTRLWEGLRPAATRAEAFALAETVLRAMPTDGLALVACGRLGQVAPE